MRRTLAMLMVLGLVLPAVPAAARNYRWVDQSGNVRYSDQPPRLEEVAPSASIATPGAAPAPRYPVHPAVDELLEMSGLKRQMKTIALDAREQVHQSLGHLEPRDLKGVAAATARTLDPDIVYASVLDEFSQSMDDTKVAAVRLWYRSPLGRKLTEIELASATPERQRELTAFVAEWQVKPPAPTRVALIQRLDAAAGATEMSVELIVGITQAVVRVADPYLPPERRLKPGQLDAQARQIRLATLEAFRQGNTVAMLYVYRNVEDQDLARYIQFLESEAGAWYGNTLRRSVVYALAAAVERTATDLVRVVPPHRWGGPGAFKKPALPPAEKNL